MNMIVVALTSRVSRPLNYYTKIKNKEESKKLKIK